MYTFLLKKVVNLINKSVKTSEFDLNCETSVGVDFTTVNSKILSTKALHFLRKIHWMVKEN